MQSDHAKRFSFSCDLRAWLANNADQAVESAMEALFDSCLTMMIGQAPIAAGWSVQRQVGVPLPDQREGRADFRLSCWDVSVLIEIDGRPWHERSEDQGERDRRRDRLLHEQGNIVLRFMGSEVHRNPFQCASEALRVCRELANKAGA